MKGKTSITVGRFWWKSIRKCFNEVKVNYSDFEYIEGPGILDKVFILYGEESLLKAIIETLPLKKQK